MLTVSSGSRICKQGANVERRRREDRGAEAERRNREYRDAEGAEEVWGFGRGVWGGNLSILSLNMATFSAFLGAILAVHRSFFHGLFKSF